MKEKIASSSTKTLQNKQKEFLWPNHLLYYTEPISIERGEGLNVWDVEGKQYLDFFGGILTTSVGHNRYEVIEAVKNQMKKLIHSSTLYLNETHIKLAEKIASLSPGKLQMSFFTPSGTDADETAIVLSKIYTGNQEVVALRHGYSGRSAMGMALSGHSAWRLIGAQVPGITHALNPYCYRCPYKLTYPSCGIACAQDVEDVIKTTTSGKIAAFIAEPIQGVGGFITAPKEYFKITREIVNHYGGLMIIDEVQTGFGRTGDKWFGIEHWDIEPDVMTMAKGIANGFPLGNVITTPEIAQSMANTGISLSTFGGNPVACAASLATLEVLENHADPQHVGRVGKLLREGLERLQEKYPVIGDVRGMGLMQGLELVKDRQSKEPSTEATRQLFEATKELGLLIGKGGLYGNVIRIAPPLTAQEEDIAEALDILDRAFAKVKV